MTTKTDHPMRPNFAAATCPEETQLLTSLNAVNWRKPVYFDGWDLMQIDAPTNQEGRR
jgi:hypothetical protein